MKKRLLIIIFFLFFWTILTILAESWGIRYDWPDNVHVDYGLPLVWSTQTTSTIVGSVNLWIVDIPHLIMNLGLWLGIMLIEASIMFYFLARSCD